MGGAGRRQIDQGEAGEVGQDPPTQLGRQTAVEGDGAQFGEVLDQTAQIGGLG